MTNSTEVIAEKAKLVFENTAMQIEEMCDHWFLRQRETESHRLRGILLSFASKLPQKRGRMMRKCLIN